MMRAGKVSVSLVLLFLLVVGGICAGGYFYLDYTQKIALINQQNEITLQKINTFESSIDSVKQTMQTIDQQFKKYTEAFSGIETKIKNNDALVSEMSNIKKNMQDWQTQQTSILNGFKAKLEQLTAKPAAVTPGQTPNEPAKTVELGQVSVNKPAN